MAAETLWSLNQQHVFSGFGNMHMISRDAAGLKPEAVVGYIQGNERGRKDCRPPHPPATSLFLDGVEIVPFWEVAGMQDLSTPSLFDVPPSPPHTQVNLLVYAHTVWTPSLLVLTSALIWSNNPRAWLIKLPVTCGVMSVGYLQWILNLRLPRRPTQPHRPSQKRSRQGSSI